MISVSEYGASNIGVQKTIDVTQTLVEDNVDLGGIPANFHSSLPTAQASGTGFNVTLQQSHFPVFSEPTISSKYSGVVYLSGKNTTGASITVTTQGKKNGTNQGATTNVTVLANCFWTVTLFRYYDCIVGDTLSVDVWASAAGLTMDYTAFCVHPTRITLPDMLQTYPNQALYRDVNYFISPTIGIVGTTLPSTGGTSIINNTQGMAMYFYNALNYTTGALSSPVGNPILTITFGRAQFPVMAPTPEYGFGRMGNGDATLNVSSGTGNSSTQRSFQRQCYLERITYREMAR